MLRLFAVLVSALVLGITASAAFACDEAYTPPPPEVQAPPAGGTS